MSDVTILGLPPSSYVRTARMVATAKGVSHQLQPVDFRSAAYAAEHPFRRMPVLHHGEVRLYETLAIATYLDEAFDGPALQPAPGLPRARMMQWISVINDYLYATMVGQCVAERFVKPMRGLEPDLDVLAAARPEIARQLGLVNDALDGQAYLCGDLSLADLFLGPVLHYLAATPEGKEMLPDHPYVQAWHARLIELPGMAEINALG